MMRTNVSFVPVAKLCALVALLLVNINLLAQVEVVEENNTCACGEGNSGYIDLVAEGTAGPFTFEWEGPNNYFAFEQHPTDLAQPGLYTVTITNAYACETILEVELEACPGINQLFLTPTGPSCNDPNNGSINLEVLGGVAPLNYEWSTGATTQNISGLALGTYSVTVTDNNGCTLSEEVILESVEPIVITGLDDCAIAGEGIVELQVTGGVLPYTYLWDTGETSDLLVASAGDYTVTVTDAGGCTEVASFSIYGEPIVSADITPTTCELATGSIILSTAAGQTVINDWQWGDGATSPNRTGLAEGTYSVTATDANNCQFSASYVIESVNSLALNGTVIDATNCDEPGNGSISLSASGGNPPYLFEWADGPTGDLRTALSAGNYEVALSDQDGCTLIQTYTVASTASDLYLSATITDDCENRGEGAIITTVTGGQAPYTYQWGLFSTATTADLLDITAGRYLLAVTDAVGCTQSAIYTVINHNLPDIEDTLSPTSCGQAQGSISLVITNQPNPDPTAFQWADGAIGPNRNNLTAGIYQLTYTDPNGCQLNESYEVLAENIAFTLSIATTNSCPTASTGSIDVVASNGVAPYTFHWSDGEETTSLRSNLAAGSYDLTVTDANGCTAVESINVGAFPALNLVADIEPISCGDHTDGSIAITVSGGAAPYTYLWSTGATTTSITGLAADDYTLTVTDAQACTAVETFSTISTEPQVQYPYIESVKVYAVSTTSSVDQVLIYDAQWLPSAWGCVFYTGGMLDISADLWQEMQDGLRELKVVARANKGLEYFLLKLEGITQGFPRIEPAGTINTVIIADFLVVDFLSSGELNTRLSFFGTDISDSQNTLLDLRANSDNLTSCASIPVLDGSCSWIPAINENWNDFDDVHRLYKGCMDVGITLSPNYDGIRYWATVEGGVYPYKEFTFTDPKGQVRRELGPNIPPTEYATEWGEYCVEVEDNEGCIAEGCSVLCPGEEDIRQMILDGVQVVPPCPGGSNGSICLPEIPEWPYKVNWVNGFESTQCIENIPAGSYPVDIIEFRCGNVVRVFLNLGSQNDPLSINLASAKSACHGEGNGRLCIQVTGGGGGYTYAWENGSTGVCNEGLAYGQCYGITVSDACGNSTSTCFELPVYKNVIWAAPTMTKACGTNNGSISIQASEGLAPYSFEWENLSTGDITSTQSLVGSSSIGDLLAGDYQVSVTDACGEQTVYPQAITVENSADLIGDNYLGAQLDIACGGQASGGINVAMNESATSNFTYVWSNGEITQDLTSVLAGNYSLTISGLGCEKEYTYTVPAINIDLDATIEPVCAGNAIGSITLTATGNYLEPLFYEWPDGSTTSNISGLDEGEYCVTVTDANLCQKVTCYEVPSLSNDLEINVEEITGTDLGSAAGAIDVTVEGGLQPYSYSWSNGSTTEDIQFLEVGSYVLTVMDANGCERTRQFNVHFCNPVGPEITAYPPEGVTPITGPGTGAINTSIHDGTPPFTYVWEGPGNFYDASGRQDLDNLSASGEYCLTVTDFCGWTTSKCFELITPEDCIDITIDIFAHDNCMETGNSRLEFRRIALGYDWHHEADEAIVHLAWNNGEMGVVRVVRDDGPGGAAKWFNMEEIISGVVEIDIENSGAHTLTVTTEKGCVYVVEASFGKDPVGFVATPHIEHIASGELLPGTDLDLLVVNELGICTICGYISTGTFVSVNCNQSFDKRMSFSPDDDPACPEGENICQNGGRIVFTDFKDDNGNITFTVPCNTTATYVREGDKCGCLFPPGTVQGLPSVLVGGRFEELEETIFAPIDNCPIESSTCWCDNTEKLIIYTYEPETCQPILQGDVYPDDPEYNFYKDNFDNCYFAEGNCPLCMAEPLVQNETYLLRPEEKTFDFSSAKKELKFRTQPKAAIIVQPNPFADKIQVKFADGVVASELKVITPLGETILSRQPDKSQLGKVINLEFPAYTPTGILYLVVKTEEGHKLVRKIVHVK